MILRKRPGILGLFLVLRGSVIQVIWHKLLMVMAIALGVVWAHHEVPSVVVALDFAPFGLIGIALSVFLSFRNGACYDRWWEARKLWGMMIQTARDIIRQTAMLAGTPERRAILMALVRFGHAAARQLRATPQAVQGPESADAALTEAGLIVSRLERAGQLSLPEALVLHESLARMAGALLGCERLATTPVPFAYTLLLHRTAYLFCTMLPFGFVDELGWVTPFAAGLVAYAFFGLDALADELEMPFSANQNAMPLSAYATTMEITLRGALGDADLPQMPVPAKYVLT